MNIDEWLDSDSAKTACLIQGRSCGKTAFALYQIKKYLEEYPDAQIVMPYHQGYYYYKNIASNIHRLFRPDDDLTRQCKELTDKVYDTLGIKDYLNKIYGDPMLKFKNGSYINPEAYDIDLTNSMANDISKIIDDQIKREEEINNMADQKYSFITSNFEGDNFEIAIKKDFKDPCYPYQVKVYTLFLPGKDEDHKHLTLTFGYRFWEQLETMLMYDLAAHTIRVNENCRDRFTCELKRAKNVFGGYSFGGYTTKVDTFFENGSLKHQIDNLHKNPFNAMPKIEKVIFNPPATIVQWKDGTKTVVKCQDGDEFDWEKGLAMAYVKRAFNNERTYYGLFKKNKPIINLPNSNMKYDPKVAKEIRIIVPKDLPVNSDLISKAHDLIVKECNKRLENGIEVEQ